jgi:cyclic pyranopterin phosphate synthase
VDKQMRDITAKVNSLRTATAQAILRVSPKTILMIQENRVPKGDPLAVAKVAAVQAAKNTPQLIPYCHPVPLDFVGVDFELSTDQIQITATTKAIYKTGVEMEALSAVSVAALNLYDMLKMLDEEMRIETIELLEKQGGKGDFKQAFASHLKAAVIVISDTVAVGKKQDRSGRLIVQRLETEGLTVPHYQTVPDEPETIRAAVQNYTSHDVVDLIITTGGTGVSPRDQTPESLAELFERRLPGVEEAMRAYGQLRTPYAMLSRSMAGTIGKTIVLCLPGSSGGVQDAMDALFPAILHTYKMLWGGGHEQAKELASSSASGAQE